MRRLLFGLALWAIAPVVVAQQPPPPGLPTPRIQNVFPAGCKAGTSIEVAIAGQDLEEPSGLFFTHPGIKAEYIPPKKEPEPDPKKPKTPERKRRGGGGTSHTFKITTASNVPLGNHDLRFVGKWGISNPRAFVVGDRIEVNEKEPNNDIPEAQRVEIGTTINGVIASGTDVDYSVFSGKAGQRVVVDCRAISIDSRARPMIEVYGAGGRKLAANRNYRETDAVADLVLPKDGDYYVRLFDFTYQSGSPEHVYRLTISTAPWIDAVFPPAIEPGKPAQVTLYGRNLPGGKPADGFTSDGRPLEKLTVAITPPTDPQAAQRFTLHDRIEPMLALQDGFEYRLDGPGGKSNAVPIFFARDKVVLKKNSGGTRGRSAELIPAPCEVAGMIHRRGDTDWYAFEAKKGERYTIELIAERNGTQADFFLSVRDGKDPKRDLSGELDDNNDTLHPVGFYTQTVDPPPFKFVAPADGKYLIPVGCRDANYLFGPRTTYRLRVAPAKPDYRAVVMPQVRFYPTGSAARQDSSQAYDLYIQRMDGFNGAVTATVEGLPAGVTARPLVLGPGIRAGVLVLQVSGSGELEPWVDKLLRIHPGAMVIHGPGTAIPFTGAIRVVTTATIDGNTVRREARPASVTYGFQQDQNVPVISRLDQSLVLAVRPEKGFYRLSVGLPGSFFVLAPEAISLGKMAPITVKQGSNTAISIAANWLVPDKQPIALTVEPLGPNPQQAPITFTVTKQPTKEKPEALASLAVKVTAMPGIYSLVIRGEASIPFVKDPMGKQKNPIPVVVHTDPIMVTVIPTSLAKVTAGSFPGGSLKIGKTNELSVKVERQYDYAGEYQVKYIPPMGVEGIAAADGVIPAGKDEIKLEFEAEDDAKLGAVNNGVIQVTALYDGKHTIVSEIKINLTVAK